MKNDSNAWVQNQINNHINNIIHHINNKMHEQQDLSNNKSEFCKQTPLNVNTRNNCLTEIIFFLFDGVYYKVLIIYINNHFNIFPFVTTIVKRIIKSIVTSIFLSFHICKIRNVK